MFCFSTKGVVKRDGEYKENTPAYRCYCNRINMKCYVLSVNRAERMVKGVTAIVLGIKCEIKHSL